MEVLKEGRTPLHLAALKDRRGGGAILCKAGADVDARDNNDLTSLHKAAVSGHSGMVQDLIKHGAAVNAHLRVRDCVGRNLKRLASTLGEVCK